jgi:hypothetical protein
MLNRKFQTGSCRITGRSVFVSHEGLVFGFKVRESHEVVLDEPANLLSQEVVANHLDDSFDLMSAEERGWRRKVHASSLSFLNSFPCKRMSHKSSQAYGWERSH